MWSNLQRKLIITETFCFPVEEESMYKKKNGKCK